MKIERVDGRYELVAELVGIDAERLREQDRFAGPTLRWVASVSGSPVRLVTVRRRPDRRLFLSYSLQAPGGLGPLTDVVIGELGTPVFTVVDEVDSTAVREREAAGFEVELAMERFSISFDRAAHRLSRTTEPHGFSLVAADAADADRLFQLDNTLRDDVPGCDGWTGNRTWFDDELSSRPPFDPSAYLVAVDDASGEYVGLVRIWKNAAGPRLGLVGVVRRCRGTMVGPWLLRQAIAAASHWGFSTFTTETSLSNQAVHPHLVRLGAASGGMSLQMVVR